MQQKTLKAYSADDTGIIFVISNVIVLDDNGAKGGSGYIFIRELYL